MVSGCTVNLSLGSCGNQGPETMEVPCRPCNTPGIVNDAYSTGRAQDYHTSLVSTNLCRFIWV